MENDLAKLFVNTILEYKLPDNPEVIDLLPYLFHRMKTKRLRKKFLQHHTRYWKFLPHSIHDEFLGKILCRPLAEVIFSKLSENGFARKLLCAVPLVTKVLEGELSQLPPASAGGLK